MHWGHSYNNTEKVFVLMEPIFFTKKRYINVFITVLFMIKIRSKGNTQ